MNCSRYLKITSNGVKLTHSFDLFKYAKLQLFLLYIYNLNMDGRYLIIGLV